MSDLPEGWTTTDLEAVILNYQSGFASGKKDVEAGVSHLRMNNIGVNGEVVLDLIRTVPPPLAKPQYNLTSGDVLVCTTNSSKLVGKCALFDLEGRFAFSNHLTRLRPRPDIISGDYLARYLWLRWQNGEFEDKCKHWVNQSTLPKEELLSTSILLPPLDEQRRIVAKVEELLGKIEGCQKRLSKIPMILKRFRQSVLAAACSSRLTADWRDRNGVPIWEEKVLGELIFEKPKNGYSAKPVKYQTPFRVLTLTATTSGEFKPKHFKYFDGPVDADSGLWLQPNDILVQRGNTIEYVGVPAIYLGHPNEFIYPDLMMRLRARPEVDSKFLYFALSWERSRNYLRRKATGTAGSMPKINQQTLINVPIDLPPLAEQHEIVRRVEALFKFADHIEARYQRAEAQVDRLTQSILAKAFRGELVPTEAELARREARDYQPASSMLERIRG